METRTDSQWKQTLLAVLQELDCYATANVQTDAIHQLELDSGLYAAHMSLESDDFWPGYVEGITRFALVLMGHYPDHHKREGGRKRENHYHLSRFRTLQYFQNPTQRVNTLMLAKQAGKQKKTSALDALSEFRAQFGFRKGFGEFLRWFREHYPEDYAAVF